MLYKNILISSPSLDVRENISGISSIVGPLVRKHPELFTHLQLGTSDSNKGVVSRFVKLVKPLKDLFLVKNKKNTLLHLNSALNPMSMARDFMVLFFCKIIGINVFLHLHGGYWMMDGRTPLIVKVVTQLMIGLSKKCIVLGDSEADILRKFYKIKSPIVVLPNFIPDEYFDNFSCVKDVRKIIFVGRLVESKNISSIPKIIELLILRGLDFSLTVCGDGPLRFKLLKELESIPSRYWSYGGVVFGEEKIKLLKESSFFILPSSSGEGMPIAMLEAMACGCVPIVTNLGSISSVVDDGITGYIAEAGDVNEFSEKLIESLLNIDVENMRSKIVLKSKDFSISKYELALFSLYGEN
jgi:glycosyltransferase involved in cell wall biosynthesis